MKEFNVLGREDKHTLSRENVMKRHRCREVVGLLRCELKRKRKSPFSTNVSRNL